MADFSDRVIALNEAAWRLRAASPKPCDLPFALALFSDERRTLDIESLARALPRTERPLAMVFRHDEAPDRLALAGRVRTLVQERGHLFLIARAELEGADGCHAGGGSDGLRTMPVHDEEEIAGAFGQADAVFLSPVHPTKSHPGAQALGRSRAVALAQASPLPVLALGGMNAKSAAALEGTAFQGFGAIGAFGSEMTD